MVYTFQDPERLCILFVLHFALKTSIGDLFLVVIEDSTLCQGVWESHNFQKTLKTHLLQLDSYFLCFARSSHSTKQSNIIRPIHCFQNTQAHDKSSVTYFQSAVTSPPAYLTPTSLILTNLTTLHPSAIRSHADGRAIGPRGLNDVFTRW
jgi:hypothetical protein